MKIKFYFGWYDFSQAVLISRCNVSQVNFRDLVRKSAMELADAGCEHTPIYPVGPMHRFGVSIDGGSEKSLDYRECNCKCLGSYFCETETEMLYACDYRTGGDIEWFMNPIEVLSFDLKKLVIPFYRIVRPIAKINDGDVRIVSSHDGVGVLDSKLVEQDLLAVDKISYDGISLYDPTPVLGCGGGSEHWIGGRLLETVCDANDEEDGEEEAADRILLNDED